MKAKQSFLSSISKIALSALLVVIFVVAGTQPASAHCDSYDGPVIVDAVQALKTNKVELVLKWVTPEQESEVASLFNKTYNLKNDKEIYPVVEKYFFETLVRLHRETEGAPYTGLKPAGTTKAIIQLSDNAIQRNDIDFLLGKLNNHIAVVVKEKYQKVAALEKVKNNSVQEGREYVEAYVDYTHTLEALDDILAHGSGAHH